MSHSGNSHTSHGFRCHYSVYFEPHIYTGIDEQLTEVSGGCWERPGIDEQLTEISEGCGKFFGRYSFRLFPVSHW